MSKRWIDPPQPPAEDAGALAADLDLPLPVAAALVSRGFSTVEDAEQFLRPRLSALSDPFLLPGMEAAVARTWRALDRNEPVLIFGDYDVDGVCSTALMVSVLSDLGARVEPFVPNRLSDGYGFTERAFEESTQAFRPGLIVTVDCGTSDEAGVARARREGIDVVVTDHHKAGAKVADAVAVVNPKLGPAGDSSDLAGVGVAFKFCHALLKEGRRAGRDGVSEVDLKENLDLVALGTIADIVPLRGENRTLARHGLARLEKTASPGLATLMDVAGVKSPVESYHVGFQIGPRLNAAGRMGRADKALELLLCENAEHARGLAMDLDADNRERKDIESRMVTEAMEMLEEQFDPDRDFGLVAGRAAWHTGVVGIVASRLVRRFHRPSVVIGIDEEGCGRGSCRSIEGFDLVQALTACGDCLLRYGGHPMAAGLEIEAERLPEFQRRFNEVARGELEGRDLRPTLGIDAWIDLSDVDDRMFESIRQLRPFGHSNPTPVWAAAGVRMLQPRVVGRGHLQMTLASGGVQHQAIGFNMADRLPPDQPMDVAFRLKRNHYQGRATLQLDIQDFRVSGGAEQRS